MAFVCLLKLNYSLKEVQCIVIIFHGIDVQIIGLAKLIFFLKLDFSISDPSLDFLDCI